VLSRLKETAGDSDFVQWHRLSHLMGWDMLEMRPYADLGPSRHEHVNRLQMHFQASTEMNPKHAYFLDPIDTFVLGRPQRGNTKDKRPVQSVHDILGK
jgi:hypothetical protein